MRDHTSHHTPHTPHPTPHTPHTKVLDKAAEYSTASTSIGHGPARDFSLPFREETDSRHHFRTAEQSKLFTNREATRDSFLGLLRTFQEVRRKLDDKRLSRMTRDFPGLVNR